MEKNAKMTAAVTAVMHCLKEEEELIFLQASAQPPVAESVSAPAPSPAVGQWALSGRYDHMQTRTMMQLKAFHR